MDLLSVLNWRYATKRMTGQPISEEKIERILESIQLSASSVGLQPYRVLVIRNKGIREKIREIAYNQPQITEASHLLVFTAWDNVTLERVEEYLERTAEVRNVPIESLGTLRAYCEGLLNNSPDQNFHWSAKQSYIALGTALIAAAEEKVDATPMEGFDNSALDDLLGLKQLGLRSVTLLPLGYRDIENDWNLNMKKVRTAKDSLFIREKELAILEN